jgi:hypothetical protein
MWRWVQDLCGAAALMLLCYMLLMWGYVLEGLL